MNRIGTKANPSCVTIPTGFPYRQNLTDYITQENCLTSCATAPIKAHSIIKDSLPINSILPAR